MKSFWKTRAHRRLSHKHNCCRRPRQPARNVELLESRSLMAAGISLMNGELLVTGTDHSETINLQKNGGQVEVSVANKFSLFTNSTQKKTFPAAQVSKIVVKAAGGDDTVVNKTNIPDKLLGGPGNDVLTGGAGASYLHGDAGDDRLDGGGGNDIVYGGLGNDTLYGGSGHDTLYGGLGDDALHGQNGADQLFGEIGRDSLYGGRDNDFLDGGMGNDVLVSIGGGHDVLTGGSGLDNIWADESDDLDDQLGGGDFSQEAALGYIHQVDEFFSYDFDKLPSSKTIPVSKELDGQKLADPKADVEDPWMWNFQANPLFASAGPTEDDIFQGGLGDCYFMSRLQAMAKVNPESIRRMVVDLGDGTYAVRFFGEGDHNFDFFDKGVAEYVRVDADFYTVTLGGSDNQLLYAGLGQEGSIWVPIVEKAFAFWRKEDGRYASIADGGKGWKNNDAVLGLTGQALTKGEPVAAKDVADWVNNKMSLKTDPIASKVATAAVDWMKAVKSELAAGKAVILGAVPQVADDTEIRWSEDKKQSTYRRAPHIYMVDTVQSDAQGKPTGITLRDPWGVYRPMTDLTRIYFCLGAGTALTVA